ncbi:MAG: hypothetical protein IJD68_04285 [Ruminococcus sp.]|nr:hypothetical protein [Ruminococcus sp.]
MDEQILKPFVFPEEMPAKDQKIDKGVIIDVVENEVKVNKNEENSHSVWEYRGKNKMNN